MIKYWRLSFFSSFCHSDWILTWQEMLLSRGEHLMITSIVIILDQIWLWELEESLHDLVGFFMNNKWVASFYRLISLKLCIIDINCYYEENADAFLVFSCDGICLWRCANEIHNPFKWLWLINTIMWNYRFILSCYLFIFLSILNSLTLTHWLTIIWPRTFKKLRSITLEKLIVWFLRFSRSWIDKKWRVSVTI